MFSSKLLIPVDGSPASLRAVHDRMPVILDPSSYDRWLDPKEQRSETLKELLRPLPDDWMTAHPVSKLVNSPKNEGPRCIERAS